MTVGDNLGFVCLLVLVGFCVFVVACGVIYFMAPDSWHDLDHDDESSEPTIVEIDTILGTVILGCVSALVFAWLVIRPLD